MKKNNICFLFLFVSLLAFIGKVKSNLIIHCTTTEHCRKCQGILRDCYLSGTSDIAKCASCAEKESGINPCLGTSASFLLTRTEIEAFIEMEPADYENIEKHHSLIEQIVHETNKRIEDNTHEHPLSNELKKKLIKLCYFANHNDRFATSKIFEQATPEEIDDHVKLIIKELFKEENSMEYIKNAMSNPAICIKDPKQWVAVRAGFVDDEPQRTSVLKTTNSSFFSKNVNLRTKSNNLYGNRVDGKCNRTSCNRFDDENECEYNVRRFDQGNCGNCWAFAAATVFAALSCRQGNGAHEYSIKYMTNCKSVYFRKKPYETFCNDGGNLTDFVNVAQKTKFLPASIDMPYDEPINLNKCPTVQSSWSNLWDGITVEEKTEGLYYYYGVYHIELKSFVDANRTNELIMMLKDYIISHGALFIGIDSDILYFFQSAKKIVEHCERGHADHAMALIGYGEYVKENGQKSEYWIIRNSWGGHWGDMGNLKIDMYGPTGCNGYVMYKAYPLLLKFDKKKKPAPFPKDDGTANDIKRKYTVDISDSVQPARPTQPAPAARPTQPTPAARPTQPVRYQPTVTPRPPIKGETTIPPRPRNIVVPTKNSINPCRRGYPNVRGGCSAHPVPSNAILPRYTFRTVLKFSTGERNYERIILSTRKNEHKEPFSCLRVFSNDTRYDAHCRKSCEILMKVCSKLSPVSDCLRKYAPQAECFYCGV